MAWGIYIAPAIRGAASGGAPSVKRLYPAGVADHGCARSGTHPADLSGDRPPAPNELTFVRALFDNLEKHAFVSSDEVRELFGVGF